MTNHEVLAVVAGREITGDKLQQMIKSLDPQTAAYFSSNEAKSQLIEELINQELLYVDAREQGFDKEPDFIAEIERLKETFLKQYALSKLFATVTITEEELKEYYEANKPQFEQPESVRASHILVETEDEAKKIIEKLNGGLSFTEAAKSYSNCPSNAQGGDLGYFSKGRMVPEFEDAAFELAVDAISGPIQTQFGYHIIKVTSKKDAGSTPFADVRSQIEQLLMQEKQQDAYYAKAEELSHKYEVVRK